MVSTAMSITSFPKKDTQLQIDFNVAGQII